MAEGAVLFMGMASGNTTSSIVISIIYQHVSYRIHVGDPDGLFKESTGNGYSRHGDKVCSGRKKRPEDGVGDNIGKTGGNASDFLFVNGVPASQTIRRKQIQRFGISQRFGQAVCPDILSDHQDGTVRFFIFLQNLSE